MFMQRLPIEEHGLNLRKLVVRIRIALCILIMLQWIYAEFNGLIVSVCILSTLDVLAVARLLSFI